MRNFIIAGAVLGSAVSVLIYERSALANTRQETAAVAEKNRALEVNIAAERATLAELEARLKTAQEDRLRMAREIEEERAAHQPVPAGAPDPAKEGTWPSTRPYFYLAKKHIPGIEYQAFNSTAGVSREAAALFGISAREHREIEGAMKSMFAHLHETELKRAVLTNTPSDLAGRPGKKISVWVPPNLDAAELKEEVGGRIAEILGGNRAALFLDRATEAAKQFDSFATEERIVTLIPKDEQIGEIIISTRSGSMFNYYDLAGDQDWTRFQYDHLLSAFLPESENLQ